MARVALIKLFTGLNLGIAQLSGELKRAGHDSLMINFKDFVNVPVREAPRYNHPGGKHGAWIAARAQRMNANFFKPFTDHEYDLLIDTLEAFAPDLIGFSTPTVGMGSTAEVTQRLKRHFKDVPFVWGGAGPTLEAEASLQSADLVCVGEGEHAIVEIARRLDCGGDLIRIPGVWAKLPTGEIAKSAQPPVVDLDTIAFPDYEESRTVYINDDRRYVNVYPHNFGRQYHIMTQRGCPYSCSFCIESWYQEQWGKKESLRRRKVDLVIEELVAAKRRHKISSVLFYDDVFTLNPRWLREFAEKYKREIGLPFWCYTYPRTTRKDDVELLRDAGCASMTMGIQSGSGTVLEAYNRPVDREVTLRAARVIAEAGVIGFFDMITMSEFETHETCRETFRFLCDLDPAMKSIGFYPMQSYPRYGYTERVDREQRRSPLTDHDYEYYHRLYQLARTTVPRRLKEALGRSRIVRRFPRLLDPLLPATLPFFYLDHGAIAFDNEMVETTDVRGERFLERLRTFQQPLTAG